jgi:hypothetical protein
MGIDQINSDKFEILAISRFKNLSSYIQYVSINEDHDHILLTCNDRALRLYQFDFAALNQVSKKESSKAGSQHKNVNANKKRIIYFKNEIKDHINNMKWQNSSFIKLNDNFIV